MSAHPLPPADFDAVLRQGVEHYRKGAWPEALACFDRVLQVHPHGNDLHNLRARACEQLDQLDEALRSIDRRIVQVYRRRTHIWPARTTFHFTAANTTPERNRRQLIADAAEWSGDGLREEDYPTWRTVFRMIMELKAPEPLVVILDEFQYFGSDAASLSHVASELNAVWEQRRPPRALVLVLSGSSISMLESLNTGAAPLYGRFAWHEQLRPFDYWYAARMASFRSFRDRALAYGIYGGTPHYLSTLRTGQALARNVERAILSPRGEVRLLLETAMVQEEGLREPKHATTLPLSHIEMDVCAQKVAHSE